MRGLKEQYDQLDAARTAYLNRARDNARLTIPTLMTEEGTSTSESFPTPYQSVGAQGVMNLAAKLLLSLFPPNAPFFRLKVDEMALVEVSAVEGARSEVEEGLATVERAVTTEIETSGFRPVAFEMLQHLLVTGNGLLYLGDETARFFPMDRFVILRDGEGRILKIIVREKLGKESLPPELTSADNPDETGAALMDDVDLYTGIVRTSKDGEEFEVWQEISGETLGDVQVWPEEELPWIAPRLTMVAGESWGRSYVEHWAGDLASLEGLSKSLVDGAAALARLLILVNPNSSLKLKDIAEAPNGSVISGIEGEVSTLNVDKDRNFGFAASIADRVEQRLRGAFLLNSFRDAERVTAEEIRQVAQELEQTLGGIYSLLSAEFQMPLAKLVMRRMAREGRIDNDALNEVEPTIVTGVEALGRGQDLQRIQAFLSIALQNLGPDVVLGYLKPQVLLTRIATATGVEPDGMLLTADEIAAQQQQSQVQQLVQETAPGVAQEAVKAQLTPQTNV